MSGIGVAIGGAGFVYAITLVVMRFFKAVEVPGWTALMVVTLVLFGFLFLSLGVIGEWCLRKLFAPEKTPAKVNVTRKNKIVRETQPTGEVAEVMTQV